MRPIIDDSGNVRFTVAGTEMAGPGFGYKLIKIGRNGVKSVNGKAVTNPAQVQAKVLYGTDRRDDEQVADVELWISKAVAKAGSPVALPHSGWFALTADYQRLYTSKHGGFIIDGKVTERNGNYEIEIDACAGVPLDKKVTFKHGKRRVINLTENPSPNNVFIALEATVSAQAKKRVGAKPE